MGDMAANLANPGQPRRSETDQQTVMAHELNNTVTDVGIDYQKNYWGLRDGRPAPLTPAVDPAKLTTLAECVAAARRAKNNDEASAAWRRVIDDWGSHREAHLRLGEMAFEVGMADAAEAHFREAARADLPPDDFPPAQAGEVLAYLAICRRRAGDLTGASKLLAEALILQPTSRTLRYMHARVLDDSGDKKAAKMHYRTAAQAGHRGALEMLRRMGDPAAEQIEAGLPAPPGPPAAGGGGGGEVVHPHSRPPRGPDGAPLPAA